MLSEETIPLCKGDTTYHANHGIFENTVVWILKTAKGLWSMAGIPFEILDEMRGVVKFQRKGDFGNGIVGIDQ